MTTISTESNEGTLVTTTNDGRLVLFGTDGPWLQPGVDMEKIFALKLSRSDEENVLGNNLLRLLAGAPRIRPAYVG